VHQRQRRFEFRQREHEVSPKAEAGRCREANPANGPLQFDAATVRRV
jgi:hypothetical protein